jgi:hypothetical protein
MAEGIQDDVVAALAGQGYEIVNVGRTWLGRLRVVAENGEIRREIVINPTTGEVLRDYSVALANLGRPLFPGADNNDVGDRKEGAVRVTTVGPGEVAADVLPDNWALGDGALGAEGAVGAPPLTVDE